MLMVTSRSSSLGSSRRKHGVAEKRARSELSKRGRHRWEMGLSMCSCCATAAVLLSLSLLTYSSTAALQQIISGRLPKKEQAGRSKIALLLPGAVC